MTLGHRHRKKPTSKTKQKYSGGGSSKLKQRGLATADAATGGTAGAADVSDNDGAGATPRAATFGGGNERGKAQDNATPKKTKKKEDDDDDQEWEPEQRAASLEAIETVQVIAALLAGTGIAFLDDLTSPSPSSETTTETTTDTAYLEDEVIRLFVMVFVGLNMYGLIVLSTQLFYLRQCMAKDVSMFDPFLKATKDTRYFALKGVLYSMVACVFVIGLRQFSLRRRSPVAAVTGLAFVCLAMHCTSTMKTTRRSFANLRKRSKARSRLRAGGNAVRGIVAMRRAAAMTAAAAATKAAAAGAGAKADTKASRGGRVGLLASSKGSAGGAEVSEGESSTSTSASTGGRPRRGLGGFLDVFTEPLKGPAPTTPDRSSETPPSPSPRRRRRILAAPSGNGGGGGGGGGGGPGGDDGGGSKSSPPPPPFWSPSTSTTTSEDEDGDEGDSDRGSPGASGSRARGTRRRGRKARHLFGRRGTRRREGGAAADAGIDSEAASVRSAPGGTGWVRRTPTSLSLLRGGFETAVPATVGGGIGAADRDDECGGGGGDGDGGDGGTTAAATV